MSMSQSNRRHSGPVDVLFVNPPSPDDFIYIRDINRHGRSSWERMIWPQTNLAILAAVSESLGLTVDIIDCIAEEISWDDYETIVARCRPRYCFSNLISVTYHNDLLALQMAKQISGAITVGMGPHITADPAKAIAHAACLDFAICHEAEETLHELLAAYEDTQSPSLDRLKSIAGLAFVPARVCTGADASPIVTATRPFIADLDALPQARHDLLPLEKYWAPFLGNYTFIETSRGCPYRCTFCRQGVFYKWKYRTRSGKQVAEEALHLRELGVKGVLFHADTFTADTDMVEEMCDTLIAAGSPVRWACNTHARNLSNKPELLQKMKRAGCWMIAIGIESGNDQILENIRKSSTTELVRGTVNEIHATGIEVWGYFVIGFPGETKETIEQTIRFAKSLPLAIAKFDIGAPYPGTAFYDYVVENGYLSLDDYEEFDQNASAVVNYPDLSAAEIKAAAKRATREFYLRPRQILRVMREATSIRAVRALFMIVRDQMRLLSKENHGKARAAYRHKVIDPELV